MNKQSIVNVLLNLNLSNCEFDLGQKLPPAPFEKTIINTNTSLNSVEFFIPAKLVHYPKDEITFRDDTLNTDTFTREEIDEHNELFDKFYSWVPIANQEKFTDLSIDTSFLTEGSIGDLHQDTYLIRLSFN